MLFNINEYVKIKLTPKGKEILKKQHDAFTTSWEIGLPSEFKINEDEDGWSEWQLWNLMQVFGEHLFNGAEVPFETTIEIVEKKSI
jgi:hypothetical protein